VAYREHLRVDYSWALRIVQLAFIKLPTKERGGGKFLTG
jgi:hypothetical protein